MFQNSSNNLITGGTFHEHESHFHSAKQRGIDLLLRESAPGAFHNSAERFDPPKCPPNTHLAILANIMDCVTSEVYHKGIIMWLYGPEAAGKSAIAQAIAVQCFEQKRLLGSFFFSRSDPNRNHGGPLVATLAYQIALSLPPSRNMMEDAIDEDPAIFKRSLKAQFTSLIIEPLRLLFSSGHLEGSYPNLIIIDGLDECRDTKIQHHILDVISMSLKDYCIPLRFLICSRPEQNLSLDFCTPTLNAVTRRLALDDTYRASADVERYLEDSNDLKMNQPFKSFIPSSVLQERNLSRPVEEPSMPVPVFSANRANSRAQFQGPKRKLVLSFDVGTAYSGISYSVLYPGLVPEVRSVTRFPRSESINGGFKVPTIIYYDRKGVVQAVGAETMREDIYEIAGEEKWCKAEWFKLHLKSKFGTAATHAIPPLPLNKTVVEVFADFLKYLFNSASSYIQDTHANGVEFWNSVASDIDFVLAHPNGWEGLEQFQMRKAAVMAGFVPDDKSSLARISFVTEGEASLHYAIDNGLPDGAMLKGEGLIIVDAGGGTIDISSYARGQGSRLTFEEIAAPQCHFHGSVFVSINARNFLEGFLSDSAFVDDIDHIVRCFDRTTKLRFRNDAEPQYVIFGSRRDNDPCCNIRYGQLKLSGSNVASFFQPSVHCVVKSVLEQKQTAHKAISHVVLVGGFAANDWLYTRVQSELAPYGLTLFRPDNHLNKAVADGAIAMYLDHFVHTRVSKVTYGSFASIPFDPSDPEHRQRSANSSHSLSGNRCLVGRFDVILPKNTKVSEEKEFKRPYFMDAKSKDIFERFSDSVWCYRGVNPNPKWRDVDPENYSKVCTIEVDLSSISSTPRVNGETGIIIYRIDFEIVLLFGLTELTAQLAWMEKGIEKRSPAKIMYIPEYE